MRDVYQLKDALLTDPLIKGALIDSYVASYYSDIFSIESGFRIADIVEKTPAYGLVLAGDSHKMKLQQCFVKQLSLQMSEVVEIIRKHASSIPVRCFTIHTITKSNGGEFLRAK